MKPNNSALTALDAVLEMEFEAAAGDLKMPSERMFKAYLREYPQFRDDLIHAVAMDLTEAVLGFDDDVLECAEDFNRREFSLVYQYLTRRIKSVY